MGSTPAVSTKGSLWGAFFVLTGGANPKGSITAQGESRGQIYLSMTEPQLELLGKAEQPPAGRCNRSGVASRREGALSLRKKRPVQGTGRP